MPPRSRRADRPGALASVRNLDSTSRRNELERARRTEALTLLLAGLSHEQIGDRLGISREGARDLIRRTLAEAENQTVEQMRVLENARLDRAQAAIWPAVLQGEVKAVQTFLQISRRRATMNGMDEPHRLALSIQVRAEMEQALKQLEATVLGDVVDAAEIADEELVDLGGGDPSDPLAPGELLLGQPTDPDALRDLDRDPVDAH